MSIILHNYAEILTFLRGVLLLGKEGYTSGNPHCSPSKGMVQLFKEYFIFCLDIAPAKTHGIAPKEDYLYSEGYVCFEYCIFWQVWGCCNYVEVI